MKTLLDFLTKHQFPLPEELAWFAMDLSGHIWGYSKKPTYDYETGQWIPEYNDNACRLIVSKENVAMNIRNEVLPHAEDSLIHKQYEDDGIIDEEPPENYYDFNSSEDAIRAMLDGYQIKTKLNDGRVYYYCKDSKRFIERFSDNTTTPMDYFISFGEVGWDFQKEQFVKWIKVNTFNRMGTVETTSSIVELPYSRTPCNVNGVYWMKLED
jgi:hypothetical protein